MRLGVAIRPFIKRAARPERTSATAAGATSSPVAWTSRNPSSDRPAPRPPRGSRSGRPRGLGGPTPRGGLGQGFDNSRVVSAGRRDGDERPSGVGFGEQAVEPVEAHGSTPFPVS